MKKLLIKLAGLVVCALLLAIATGSLVKHELTKHEGVPDNSLLSYLSPSMLWLVDSPQRFLNSLVSPFTYHFLVPDRFPEHTGFVGKPTHEERYLLLTRYDGDISRPVAELVDLRTFEVQHTWMADQQEFADVWNEQLTDSSDPSHTMDVSGDLLKHPMMVEDGLLFNGFYNSVKKVDACSRRVWQIMPSENGVFHHSLEVDLDGNIWLLGETDNQFHPDLKDGIEGKTFYDQSIVKTNADGEVLFAKSISEILIENDLGYILWGTRASAYDLDLLHSNDVQPALSDTEYWKKGDVLISMYSLSMVLLYRPSNNKIIWHSLGYATGQHDPDFVGDSRIAIFDNNMPFGFRPSPSVDQTVVDESVWSDGHSQVIVYDFATQQYSSYLNESLRAHEVQTSTQGRSEILPNGDLYVEETDSGRTLYFNADGSLRWSHVNRAKNGNPYYVGWSRILYRDHEIALVRDFLENKDERLEACRDPS